MNAMQRLQASVARHWDNLGAEPTDYADGSGRPAVRVAALWGAVEPLDPALGVRGYTCTVWVRASELSQWGDALTPARGRTQTLTRYPDDFTGAERWELWEPPSRVDPSQWRFTAVRTQGFATVPRG